MGILPRHTARQLVALPRNVRRIRQRRAECRLGVVGGAAPLDQRGVQQPELVEEDAHRASVVDQVVEVEDERRLLGGQTHDQRAEERADERIHRSPRLRQHVIMGGGFGVGLLAHVVLGQPRRLREVRRRRDDLVVRIGIEPRAQRRVAAEERRQRDAKQRQAKITADAHADAVAVGVLALHVLVAHDRLQQGELLRRRQQQLVVGDAQPHRAALLAVEVAVAVDLVVAGHNGTAARARAVVGDGTLVAADDASLPPSESPSESAAPAPPQRRRRAVILIASSAAVTVGRSGRLAGGAPTAAVP